jgi:hypothetical protein
VHSKEQMNAGPSRGSAEWQVSHSGRISSIGVENVAE